jgi:hypothetical protein
MRKFIILIFLLLLTSCSNANIEKDNNTSEGSRQPVKNAALITPKISLINESGNSIKERIKVPEGFERIEACEKTYAEYLRNLPLKPIGAKVRLYNGQIKGNDVYDAVIDMDIGDKDLQQCADAVIRLRAEYLYKNKIYDKIHFNFTNGFKADYKTWMNGNRIYVSGNKASWVKKTGYSNEYSSFRKYLDMVFSYAGTLSLDREMKKVSLEDIQIGDVFIKGASPGHTVIVVDMAKNKSTGEVIFLIAQSYMPAQEIHLLKNLQNDSISPWYSVNFGDTLNTPEWDFSSDQIKRFNDI